MRLTKFKCQKCDFTRVVDLDKEDEPVCRRHSLHFQLRPGELTDGVMMDEVPAEKTEGPQA